MPSIRLLQETIGALTKTSTTVVSLAPSRVTVGGQQFATTTLNCNVSLLGLGGLDASIQAWKLYYVYVVASGGTPYLIASTLSTGPAGYSAYKLVGYFDTDNVPNINGAASELQGSVGDIKSALMTEAQFVAANGPGWILADGRNVAGSAWATLASLTTAPDARGMVLRGKNNSRADGNQDPDGERALGGFQGHQFGSHDHGGGGHSHTVNSHNHGGGGHSHTVNSHNHGGGVHGHGGQRNRSGNTGGDGRYVAGGGGSGTIDTWQVNASGVVIASESPGTNWVPTISSESPGTNSVSTISSNGGNETRMRNVAVNHFIKIN